MSKRTNEITNYLEYFLKWVQTEGYIQIKSCSNIREVPKKWRINKRCHDDFHLLYIRGGKGEYFIEGEHFPFEAGRILFLSYNTTHWGGQNIQFPPSIIPLRFQLYSNKTHERIQPLESPFYFSFDPENFNQYHSLFETINRVNSEENSSLRNSLSHVAILNLISTLYLDCREMKRKNDLPLGIIRAKKLMDDNPHIHMELHRLAEEAELSIKYFGKIFKDCFGVSPCQYQIKNRIAYARFLIENTDNSIKEIAIQLGYPDPYTFTKQFKQCIGVAPTKLR